MTKPFIDTTLIDKTLSCYTSPFAQIQRLQLLISMLSYVSALDPETARTYLDKYKTASWIDEQRKCLMEEAKALDVFVEDRFVFPTIDAAQRKIWALLEKCDKWLLEECEK